MKNLILFLTCFTLTAVSVFAEDCDEIYTLDQQQIKCTVSEISDSEVKYKRADRPSTITYSMRRDQVMMIRFCDGTVEMFAAVQPTTPATPTAPTAPATPVAPVAPSAPATPTVAPQSTQPAVETPSNTPVLARAGSWKFQYGGQVIKEEDAEILLQNQSPAAYENFKKGKGYKIAGDVLLGYGIGSVVGSLILYSVSNSLKGYINTDYLETAKVVSISEGVVCTALGITFMIVGNVKYNRAVTLFNAGQQGETDIVLNYYVAPSQCGIALNF